MKKFIVIFSLLFLCIFLVSCNSNEIKFSFEDVKNKQIDHIHGLGYINGKNEFVIATHNGLYEYGNEGWKEANSKKHDYMGFAAVREGFYSSGHPEEDSSLKNPLGLIKSTDQGASLEQLSFYGELDFHYLAAGYNTNIIYVFNEKPTESLKGGLHYSSDEGNTWNQVAINGIKSNFISNFAAHPSKEEILVIGSDEGVYISKDYGQNFSKLTPKEMVTYVSLNEDGGYYSSIGDKQQIYLKLFSLENSEVKNILLPKGTDGDPIIFIAENPNNQNEIVLVTNNLNIYQTKDQGNTWNKLSANGTLDLSK